MTAVDGLIDDTNKRHHVKNVIESLKNLLGKLSAKLVVHFTEEGVLTLLLSCLMVASEEVNSIRSNQLEAEKVEDAFDAVLTTIDVVTQEEKTARTEVDVRSPDVRIKGKQIGKVTVNVPQDVARACDLEDARTTANEKSSLFANVNYIGN